MGPERVKVVGVTLVFQKRKSHQGVFININLADKPQVICQSITKDYEFVIGIRCQPRVEIVLP